MKWLKYNFISRYIWLIIPIFFTICFVLTFPFSSYIAGGDGFPLFYTDNSLVTQLYTWANSITFWSVSWQSGYIILQPLLCLLSALQFIFWNYGAQYIFFLLMFIIAPSGVYFMLRSFRFSKSSSILWSAFYGFNVLVWAGMTRNTLHITNFFVYTPLIIALIKFFQKTWLTRYIVGLIIVGVFNIFIVVNPWTIGIQLLLVLWFTVQKISYRYLKSIFTVLLATYWFSVVWIIALFMLLFNSANIQQDERNNKVLMEGAMLKERKNSSVINTIRGLNGDLFDVWWYVDLNKSEEFYTPFPYANVYKTKLFYVISFLPLFLLIISLISFKGRRKAGAILFWFVLLAIFLVKGVWEPFWWIFEYCLNNVPLCGVFRSPHQKFSLFYVLIIIYSLCYYREKINGKRRLVFDSFLWTYIILMGSFHFFYPYISRQNIIKEIPSTYKELSVYIEGKKEIKNILVLPFNEWTWTNTDFWFEWYQLFSYLLPKHQFYGRNDLAFSSFAKNIHEKLWPEINKRGDKTLEYMNKYYIDTLIYDGYTDRYTRFAQKEEHEENIKRLDSLTGLNKLWVFWRLHIYHINSYPIFNGADWIFFTRINPTKYSVSLQNFSGSIELSFLQSFHPQRKLYLSKKQVSCQSDDQLKYSSYQYLTGEAAAYTGLVNLTGQVKRGDSRARLAQQNNLSIAQLKALNPSTATLEPNQELVIWQKQELLTPETRMVQTGTGNITECINKDYTFFEGEELKYLYEKPIFDSSHHLVNDYANGRTLDANYIKKNFPKDYYKENPDGSIDVNLTLYFRPQSYFYLGLWVSGVTFFWLIAWLFVDRRRQKNLVQQTSAWTKNLH